MLPPPKRYNFLAKLMVDLLSILSFIASSFPTPISHNKDCKTHWYSAWEENINYASHNDNSTSVCIAESKEIGVSNSLNTHLMVLILSTLWPH